MFRVKHNFLPLSPCETVVMFPCVVETQNLFTLIITIEVTVTNPTLFTDEQRGSRQGQLS